ncbi:MAG: hypothetical protein ACL93V_07555 [Candidatus Electrothrix sp. YB6]
MWAYSNYVAPAIWQQNLESALAVFRNRAQDKVARELHQILSEKNVKGRGRSRPKVFPVNATERESLLHALQTGEQQDTAHLAERFFRNQEQNLRFAELTGNSYFFIRTLCKQGDILFKRYNLSAGIMRRLERMIEQGLAWEPYNPFVWTLWADWHAKKKTRGMQIQESSTNCFIGIDEGLFAYSKNKINEQYQNTDQTQSTHKKINLDMKSDKNS